MRNSWEEYFIDLAYFISKRSTCLRRNIGAVAIKNKRILATGFNGAPSGIKHCEYRGGCIRNKKKIPSGEKQEVCLAVHAESNVIIQAATYNVSLKDSTLYCTNQPCIMCSRMIINVGFDFLVYVESYPDKMTNDLFKEIGVFETKDIGKYKNVNIWDFKTKR